MPLQKASDTCAACTRREYAFDQARAWGQYRDELRAAILQLKHRRNAALGEAFARPLVALLSQLDYRFDAIAPIPLAPGRLRARGFNQIELLALPVAQAANRPMIAALRRTHETAPQMDLQLKDRWINLAGAFRAEPELVKGRHLLVIDDIMTTGATMHAAAQALKAAGASHVACLALSRALTRDEAAHLVR